MNGFYNISNALIQANASLNIQDNYGRTALMWGKLFSIKLIY